MPNRHKPCEHGWYSPGDAWREKRVINADHRVMQCLLCKRSVLECYDYKTKKWGPMPAPYVPKHLVKQGMLPWEEANDRAAES